MLSAVCEEILNDLVSSERFGIIALDADGRLQIWNKGAERIFGWSETDVLGRPVPAALQLQNLPQGVSQTTLSRKDGAPIDIELWTGPWRDAEGKKRAPSQWLPKSAD